MIQPPRVLLLQARNFNDPMLEHELNCFVQSSRLPRKAFQSVNMVVDTLEESILSDADVVMVGGSGEYSVVKGGFSWHEPMLKLMRTVVRRKMPMFASCFGHQALMQSLGGSLFRDESQGEVGTFEITLNQDGETDSVFGSLPKHFMAQLGHLDYVETLPQEAINLAFSDLCSIQAVRLKGTSIVSTQFHPEMTVEAQLDRWFRYIELYREPGESLEDAKERARSICTASPESSRLLRLFLENELGYS